jgi:hypothetical protein
MRQIILEFNNLTDTPIKFNHQLYIDDEPREDIYSYAVEHNTDPMSPDFGRVFVSRSYVEPNVLDSVTSLGIWTLSSSQFPNQTIVKAHLDVSGKGFYPRFRLVTRNSSMYELNGISWVYRDMNAR